MAFESCVLVAELDTVGPVVVLLHLVGIHSIGEASQVHEATPGSGRCLLMWHVDMRGKILWVIMGRWDECLPEVWRCSLWQT